MEHREHVGALFRPLRVRQRATCRRVQPYVQVCT